MRATWRPPTRRPEPVFRRRDWAFPAPPADRELREVLPEAPSDRPPLLFVHGAWEGAWIWERWMARAAQAGWPCYAVSLRGHGDSSGSDTLKRVPLRYYEHDVLQTITHLPAPPVLVGHSTGGLIVQHVLERYRSAPAGVLLASVPPGHGMEVAGALLRQDPAGLARAAVGRRPRFRRETIVGPSVPEAEAARYQAGLGDESLLVTYQLILPRHTPQIRSPLLVLGGGDDRIVPPWATVRTARAHGTRAHLLRGVGHGLMLGDTGDAVLQRVLDWVEKQVL